ncbi:MAG: GNAT family N-acetyltransferase [Rhodobacter sp.]|nr:GNAT family N-acetyltransferase [Rhodobacter sp.]
MTNPKPVAVRIGDPRHPQATALLQASHALMESLFPSDSNHYLSIDDLCVPEITFFTAHHGDTILGTGALANKTGYGEIKSMFVAPDARGTGTGAALLNAIETEARAQGLPVLRLETGNSLHAAHRLYRRAGFALRGPFGDYPDDPISLFMEKPLG